MSNRKVRVGIDVGGTHTKAVALDNETNEIVGESIVKTTHDDEKGVATGVIQCFQNCLTENNIDPDDVVFIAHSTTQATNALIEGDVAKVGILAMGGGGFSGWLAKSQSKIGDILLDSGRYITTTHTYLANKKKDPISEERVKAAVDQLVGEGATVIAASEAFGVDSIEHEMMVKKEADSKGVMASVASDISKLYGLSRRTRTAAINGSILPKMMDTANCTEGAVREAGVDVPLMIMRGDGGVMGIDEMRKRPVLTMLSGPAASVMGALMYLRASNGIYFEVGGTTTNIGVIKNGRPGVEYASVGGHDTYVNSLDVKVQGVAGGSMVRAGDNKIVDVGPRSAHIAGLGYAVYYQGEVEEPELEFFSPKEGDPADYVRIKLKNGDRVTLTNSCAANVLGYVQPGDYSYGNVENARKCIKPLADYCGMTIEECAKDILYKAYLHIEPIILNFAEKYKIDRDQIDLVGCGGGAKALLPFSAEQLNMNYSIADHAEVISSIGVALAMIRDVVERVIPNPTTEDIRQIKKEAKEMAIKNGAVPETVEVQIEIDNQTSKVTAIAMGSNEVQATDLSLRVDEESGREIAAKSMRCDKSEVETMVKVVEGDVLYIYGHKNKEKMNLRVVDHRGFVKVQCGDAIAEACCVKDWETVVPKMWEQTQYFKNEMARTPDFFLGIGGKLLDFTSYQDLETLEKVMRSEFIEYEPDDRILLVAARAEML